MTGGPAASASQEADAEGSLEPRSSGPAWATQRPEREKELNSLLFVHFHMCDSKQETQIIILVMLI